MSAWGCPHCSRALPGGLVAGASPEPSLLRASPGFACQPGAHQPGSQTRSRLRRASKGAGAALDDGQRLPRRRAAGSEALAARIHHWPAGGKTAAAPASGRGSITSSRGRGGLGGGSGWENPPLASLRFSAFPGSSSSSSAAPLSSGKRAPSPTPPDSSRCKAEAEGKNAPPPSPALRRGGPRRSARNRQGEAAELTALRRRGRCPWC